MAFILSTMLLTVYCQLVVKWRVSMAGAFPAEFSERAAFFTGLFLDPWMMSLLPAAFIAGLAWFAAMTKYELSYAYPFMSLAFVLVLVLSAFLFHEAVTLPKVLGIVLITVGLIIASQG